MKERPILFSAPMVRAILEGRKTQTRRVMNPQPVGSDWRFDGRRWQKWYGYPVGHDVFLCPYGEPGDRLWVRETWAMYGDTEARAYRAGIPAHYANTIVGWLDWPYSLDENQAPEIKWKPSIFMPRWASRITLEVVSVRVEQLQDISDEDCEAEGVAITNSSIPGVMRTRYQRLWNSISAGRGFEWDTNPWVWVIEFKAVTP